MIGVISDIHGNYPALQAVIFELEKKNCEKIFCLGDITGYYCMINECINLLREKQVICIKGNHDSYLLGEGRCPRSETVNKCIDYQKKIISPKNLLWLEKRGKIIINDIFCAVHGGWHNFLDEYIDILDFDEKEIIKYEVDIFLSGHTHKQVIQRVGKKVYCNPGSVGQPRDYNPQAAYATIDNRTVSLCRCDYNISEIAMQMCSAGFDEYYYKNLFRGCKIGEVSSLV